MIEIKINLNENDKSLKLREILIIELIKIVLEKHNFVKYKAALEAGFSIRALRNHINKHKVLQDFIINGIEKHKNEEIEQILKEYKIVRKDYKRFNSLKNMVELDLRRGIDVKRKVGYINLSDKDKHLVDIICKHYSIFSTL